MNSSIILEDDTISQVRNTSLSISNTPMHYSRSVLNTYSDELVTPAVAFVGEMIVSETSHGARNTSCFLHFGTHTDKARGTSYRHIDVVTTEEIIHVEGLCLMQRDRQVLQSYLRGVACRHWSFARRHHQPSQTSQHQESHQMDFR